MIPFQFAGMSWDVLTRVVEEQHEVPIMKVDIGDVAKLPKRDMQIFGLCPQTEPVMLVTCQVCSMVVKSQALLEHYERRHVEVLQNDENICGESTTLVKNKEAQNLTPCLTLPDPPSTSTNVVHNEKCTNTSSPRNFQIYSSPLSESPSKNLFVTSDNHKRLNNRAVVPENTKKQCMISCKSSAKCLKQSAFHRNPLSHVSVNSCQGSKRKFKIKRKCKPRISVSAVKNDSSFMQCEKEETSVVSSLENTSDDTIPLLQRLPELKLNVAADDQVRAVHLTNELLRRESFSFDRMKWLSVLSYEPRPLSTPGLCSYNKIGGLLYPDRHMELVRQSLLNCFDDSFNIPNDRLKACK